MLYKYALHTILWSSLIMFTILRYCASVHYMRVRFYILSLRGDTIITRDFRGDVVKGTAEIFFRKATAEITKSKHWQRVGKALGPICPICPMFLWWGNESGRSRHQSGSQNPKLSEVPRLCQTHWQPGEVLAWWRTTNLQPGRSNMANAEFQYKREISPVMILPEQVCVAYESSNLRGPQSKSNLISPLAWTLFAHFGMVWRGPQRLRSGHCSELQDARAMSKLEYGQVLLDC